MALSRKKSLNIYADILNKIVASTGTSKSDSEEQVWKRLKINIQKVTLETLDKRGEDFNIRRKEILIIITTSQKKIQIIRNRNNLKIRQIKEVHWYEFRRYLNRDLIG